MRQGGLMSMTGHGSSASLNKVEALLTVEFTAGGVFARSMISVAAREV